MEMIEQGFLVRRDGFMRKLAITITALLLCAVTALMLMSVGVILVPEAFRWPV